MVQGNPLKRVWHLIILEKTEVISIYFYAILSGLLQLSLPIGIQAIIGFVLGASMVTSLYILIILVVIGVFAVGIMQVNQMKMIEKIQQNIFTRNAFEFAEKIPQFDLCKTDNYYLPEKVNRFFDTLNVQKSLSKLLLDIPIATIQILFGLLLLIFYHPIFIVFSLLLITILWLILKFTSKKGLISSLQESTNKYASVAWLQEIASNIGAFKFSQTSSLGLANTDKNVLNYLTSRTAHFKVLLFQYKTLVAFKVIITTAMLTVGTYLLLDQQLNIGEFIAAEIVIITVINAIEKIISSLDSVYDVATGLEKLASVTEISLEKEGTMMPTSMNSNIELIDFNFEFPDGKKILKDVNISIPAHSTVCISGKEGAGKSTLLKILAGYYLTFTGNLLINNIPLNNYNLDTLRNRMGIYLDTQDIFTGTILENITMGRNEITPAQVLTLAEKMGVENFLKPLPQGFDTQIDPKGKKLPSTLVSKILLLRAFANNPDLLLMKQPWQGLEETTKTVMIDYLLSKPNHATVIIASNDEKFASKCDYHIYLANGFVTITKNTSI